MPDDQPPTKFGGNPFKNPKTRLSPIAPETPTNTELNNAKKKPELS